MVHIITKRITKIHKQSIKRDKKKISVREKISNILELPDDIMLDMPKITLTGNKSIIIENYKGLVEYDNEVIKLNTGIGLIVIKGKRLLINEIAREDIMVSGEITGIEIK